MDARDSQRGSGSASDSRQAVFERIVARYLEGLDRRAARIRQALEREDWNDLHLEVHQIQGTAGTFGFHEVSLAAERCNKLLRGGADAASIREQTEELLERIDASAAETASG